MHATCLTAENGTSRKASGMQQNILKEFLEPHNLFPLPYTARLLLRE